VIYRSGFMRGPRQGRTANFFPVWRSAEISCFGSRARVRRTWAKQRGLDIRTPPQLICGLLRRQTGPGRNQKGL